MTRSLDHGSGAVNPIVHPIAYTSRNSRFLRRTSGFLSCVKSATHTAMRPDTHTSDTTPEYGNARLVPVGEAMVMERHRPRPFKEPYHHHASIEMNFITGCDMDYSFSGEAFTAPTGRPIVFWGAIPHCVTSVKGAGQTINIYVGFAQILGWQLPDTFIDALIGGDVLVAGKEDPLDALQFDRWAREYGRTDAGLRQVLLGEVEMRLRRFALSPWSRLSSGKMQIDAEASGAARVRYIEDMLRFIANNYANAISVSDVADHVNLSPNYAMTLFRRVIGVPIKEHITRIRLSHAQMLLATTDMKILSVAMDSGFGSLSSFYEAFQARLHQSPAAFRRQSRRGGA